MKTKAKAKKQAKKSPKSPKSKKTVSKKVSEVSKKENVLRPGYFGKRFREEDSGEIRGKTKTSKILGYCVCGLAISQHDYEEGKKTIVICPRCGTRKRRNRLEADPKNIQLNHRPKPKSKKDYFDTGDFEEDVVSVYADEHSVSKTPITSKKVRTK